MLSEVPDEVLRCMRELERLDARDRQDGTPRLERLRQVPPETGRLLAILAAGAPPGAWLELGTSAGYSALWLALAAREAGRRLTTFELLPEKAALARATFERTGVGDVVELVEGDVRERLPVGRGVAFCFLDLEKELYLECYEALVPDLVRGGLLVADNVASHREPLAPFVDRARSDGRVDAVEVPLGKGLLLCRRAAVT